MRLIRSISKKPEVPREDMPPRPQRTEPGPVTAPRLFAPMGHVDQRFDPCGAPPISSDEGESA